MGEKTLAQAIADGEISLDNALTAYRPPTTGERAQTFAGILAKSARDAYLSGTSAELRIAERGLAMIGADKAAEWMRGFADYVQPGGRFVEDVAETGFDLAPEIPAAAANEPSALVRAFTQYLPEGLGSSAGILALPGPRGLSGVALRGAMVGAGQQFTEAKANGADDGTAWTAFAGGALLGATDAWSPLGKLLERADRGSGGMLREILWEGVVKGGAQEFTQEVGQTIGENVLAGFLYDEDRKIIENVLEAGQGGALTGMLLGALVGASGRRAGQQGQQQRPEPQGPEEAAPQPIAEPDELTRSLGQDLGADTYEEAPGPIRRYVEQRGGRVVVASRADGERLRRPASYREGTLVLDRAQATDAFLDHEVGHLAFDRDPEGSAAARAAIAALAPELEAQSFEDYVQDVVASRRREAGRDLTADEVAAIRAETPPDEAFARVNEDFSGVVRLLRTRPDAFAKVDDPSVLRRIIRAVADLGRRLTGKPIPDRQRQALQRAWDAAGGPSKVAPEVGIEVARTLGGYLDSLPGRVKPVPAGTDTSRTADVVAPGIVPSDAAEQGNQTEPIIGTVIPEVSTPTEKPRALRARPVKAIHDRLIDLSRRQTVYQGNKREFLQKNADKLARLDLDDVETLVDMYAGGGTYGMTLAVAGMTPNLKRVAINEVDPLRLRKLQLSLEGGAQFLDRWDSDPLLAELGGAIRDLIASHESTWPARAALEGLRTGGGGRLTRFQQRVLAASPETQAALLAIEDVMHSGLKAPWERLRANAREAATNVHNLATELRGRGVTVEPVSVDARSPDAAKVTVGKRSLVVLDPPYHGTSSGSYSIGGQDVDFGSTQFLQENVDAAARMLPGNVLIYNNSLTPEVKRLAGERFRGTVSESAWQRQKRGNRSAQSEFLGIYDGRVSRADVGNNRGSQAPAAGSGGPGVARGLLATDGRDARGSAGAAADPNAQGDGGVRAGSIPEPTGVAPAPGRTDTYVGRRLLSFPARDLDAAIARRLAMEDAALREQYPDRSEAWYARVADKRRQARDPANLEGDRAAGELRRMGVQPVPPDQGGYTTEDYLDARAQQRTGKPDSTKVDQGPRYAAERRSAPEGLTPAKHAVWRRALPTSGTFEMPWDIRDRLLEFAADSFRAPGKWRDALATAGRLTEANDIVLQETLRRQGTLKVVTDEGANYVAPLRELVSGPVSLDEAGLYLLARAAPARNALVEARGGGPNGSGMTDADADRIVQAAESGTNAQRYRDIAAAFDRLTNRKLDLMEQYGLLSPDQVANLRAQEPFYAPMKTDEHVELLYGERERPEIGIGRTRRREFRGATGRGTVANNPIVFATMDMMAAVERGMWNATTGRAILETAREFSDPRVAVVDEPAMQRTIGPNGQIVERPAMTSANEIVVKENGVPRVVRFGRGWELVATALKGGDGKSDILLDAIRPLTRTIAALSTRWNPFFWPVNMGRDALGAYLNATGDVGPKAAAEMVNPKTVGAAARELFQRGPWAQRFENAGAPVAFLDLARTFHEEARRTIRDIERTRSANTPWSMTRRQMASIGEAFNRMAEITENATRLAAFKYAIEELGMSDARAAEYAKGLTTNFERKGSNPYMYALYAFSNAGVQGTARVGQALRMPWGQRAAAGLVAGAFLLSYMNRITGGDDEDGVPRWDKIPDWQRRSNAIFLVGDKKVMVPMPFVWNIFHALGTEIERGAFGGQTPLDSVRAVGSALAGTLNPLGGEADLIDTLTPTIVDPLQQIARNQDYAGRQIFPEARSGQVPDSELAWDTTSPSAMALAKGLNSLSGGDAGTPGLVDVSPATFEFIVKQYLGGVGGESSRILRFAEKILSGESWEAQDVPLVRRFVGLMGLAEQRGYYRSRRSLIEAQVLREKAGDAYDKRLWGLRKRANRWDEKISDLEAAARQTSGPERDRIRAQLREVFLEATEAIEEATSR